MKTKSLFKNISNFVIPWFEFMTDLCSVDVFTILTPRGLCLLFCHALLCLHEK